MNKPALKSALCTWTGASLICEFVQKVQKQLEINMFRNESNNDFNGLFFYGAEDELSRHKIGLKNILCIYICIKRARITVDVCVPSLASDSLANCLVTMRQNRKVNVRIAIHNSDDFRNLQLLAQNGIEVKVIKPHVRLAHDFALMDMGECDALAVLGALDYDTESPLTHRDATVVTTDPAMLTALNREFQRVWNSVSDEAFTRANSEID